jgi:hypothetical protein
MQFNYEKNMRLCNLKYYHRLIPSILCDDNFFADGSRMDVRQ